MKLNRQNIERLTYKGGFLRVGITGGIATGKSTFSKFIEENGFTVLNSDLIARDVLEIYEEIKEYLKKEYGHAVFNGDELIRSELGRIVFNNSSKLREYEKVILPYIEKEIKLRFKKVQDEGHRIAFLEAPILFEYGKKLVDISILVDMPLEMQLKRVMERDNLNSLEAMNRISKQMKREDKIEMAEIIVDNQSSLEDLKKEALKTIIFLKEYYDEENQKEESK